jgi:hypothetical protein
MQRQFVAGACIQKSGMGALREKCKDNFWKYSANLSFSQHKACVRGRQWLADRVAAANRSDAFHIDSPISENNLENNFVSPEDSKTFLKHSKYIPEAMLTLEIFLIPEIFLTRKNCKLNSISNSVALVRFIRLPQGPSGRPCHPPAPASRPHLPTPAECLGPAARSPLPL